jgi:hypothetical protein
VLGSRRAERVGGCDDPRVGGHQHVDERVGRDARRRRTARLFAEGLDFHRRQRPVEHPELVDGAVLHRREAEPASEHDAEVLAAEQAAAIGPIVRVRLSLTTSRSAPSAVDVDEGTVGLARAVVGQRHARPLLDRQRVLADHADHVAGARVLKVELQPVLVQLQLIAGVAAVVVLAMVEDRRVLVDLVRPHPQVDAERLRALVVADPVAQHAAIVVVEEQRLPLHAILQNGRLEHRGRRTRRTAGAEPKRIANEIRGQRADAPHDLLQFLARQLAAIGNEVPELDGATLGSRAAASSPRLATAGRRDGRGRAGGWRRRGGRRRPEWKTRQRFGRQRRRRRASIPRLRLRQLVVGNDLRLFERIVGDQRFPSAARTVLDTAPPFRASSWALTRASRVAVATAASYAACFARTRLQPLRSWRRSPRPSTAAWART